MHNLDDFDKKLSGPPNYAPWLVIAWRLPWFVPLQITRILFCLLVLCAYGTRDFERAWRDTE